MIVLKCCAPYNDSGLYLVNSELVVLLIYSECQAGIRFGPEQALLVPGGSWHLVFHNGECLQMPKGMTQ
jgi:hypothetical protein